MSLQTGLTRNKCREEAGGTGGKIGAVNRPMKIGRRFT
ncbi:hypothetical protein ADIS_3606 [Lunatimonas lonarensis]|uniref:Uncharacterized protein n=1 Tax=Lunatimonas lonarensis TaxID=1232681 RepID=R7ZP69_9BACT|nr:hypothetical protein ADIS_3606 [Lunatimonas lonarensis]